MGRPLIWGRLALWPVLLLLPVTAGWGAGLVPSRQAPSLAEARQYSIGQSISGPVFLPLVARAISFEQNSPIWAHTVTPAGHEVVLFRQVFSLGQRLEQASLYIFADTRYEAWLDGIWLGRGPARFSRLTREYDSYSLGSLPPGEHLLAVLVQWAPNYRRSESTTPYLQAHVEGLVNRHHYVATRSGPDWKAMLSPAWQHQSALVHSWGLVGPTELLDLRALPADWMAPGFEDQNWPYARVKTSTLRVDISRRAIRAIDPGTGFVEEELFEPAASASFTNTAAVTYQPRSIPPLERVERSVTVADAGLLSPARYLAEMFPPVSATFTQAVLAAGGATLSVEALSIGGTPPADTAWLDGMPLAWRKAGELRPGVYTASIELTAGEHSLHFSNVPADGMTFAVSRRGLEFPGLPFGQGLHAGRRLLLANPHSQPEQVEIQAGDGLSATFNTLPAYLVLDLGRVVQGRLEAEVQGAPGALLDIGWDERLYRDARPLPYPGGLHKEWNQVDSWVLDGTWRHIATLDSRAGRYILIAAWGESPIQVSGLRVYEERFPLSLRGSFQSSDPLLDQVWQVGVDTLYANMSDAYADPWRERGQWWGDAYVDYHANLAAFGDTDLLKRGLAFMAEAFQGGRPKAMAPNGDGNHMLDYGMLWAQSLVDYWRLTGDTSLVAQAFPALRDFIAYLQAYKSPNSGLLDIPRDHWSVTTLIDWAGAESRYGQSTAVNALYIATLQDAATLAAALGQDQAAGEWSQEAKQVEQALNELLFSSLEGRYLTSQVESDLLPPTPHAQAWPLAYGLVPPGQLEAVSDALLELISSDPGTPNVEIYGFFWVLEGLGRAGRISDGIDLIKAYYGRMLELGATTWWESFNANQHYWAGLSHGWGSAPTWFLTTYILGARRSGPDSWQVKPAFAGVSQASGELPLPGGVLKVGWEAGGCGQFAVSLLAPAGTTGEVVLPSAMEGSAVWLDGSQIWASGRTARGAVSRSADGLHIVVGDGSHRLEISPALPGCTP